MGIQMKQHFLIRCVQTLYDINLWLCKSDLKALQCEQNKLLHYEYIQGNI